MATKDYINKITCGDCLKLMKDLDDNSVDLVVTDPPYGQTHYKWDKEPEWKLLFKELKRVLVTSGQIFVFGKNPMLIRLFNSAMNIGFNFRYELIWIKNHPAVWASNKRPLQAHENIFCLSLKDTPINELLFNYEDIMIDEKPTKRWGKSKGFNVRIRGGFKHDIDVEAQRKKEQKLPQTILYYKIVHPSHSKEYTGHPTQKPLGLITWIIKAGSNENNIVLDPFGGAGTVAVACKQLNRNSITFEIDPYYCKIAEKRLAQKQLHEFNEV